MTSVVVWKPKEQIFGSHWSASKSIHLAADSRITRPSASSNGISVATDSAAKLLRIPFEIFENYEHGPGCVPAYQGDIGFAFAGTVHPAVFTYSLCAAAFQSLRVDPSDEWPDFEVFVAYIARVATKYVREICAEFEAFIIGCDPNRSGTNDSRCFQLAYDGSIQAFTQKELDLDPCGSFGILGADKPRIHQIIQTRYSSDSGYNPEQAILDEIDKNAGAIGGSLQRARAYKGGFQMLPTLGTNQGLDFREAFGMHLAGEFGSVGDLRVQPYIEGY